MKKKMESSKRITRTEISSGSVDSIEIDNLNNMFANIELSDVDFNINEAKKMLEKSQGSTFTIDNLILRVARLDNGEAHWRLDQYIDYTDIRVTEMDDD